MMQIGFISFNQDALNRANKVMKLLQGQGAIDELGLGRIRDAFSNMMFPGMSVLQTHAKYFVLLPALYAHLEKSRIDDAREARNIVRDSEIRLTRRFMDGPNKDMVGIIGADMLRRGEAYVKYDPTYVYLAGMETYGLIPRDINIYAFLAERSRNLRNMPLRHTGADGEADDSHDLTGDCLPYRTSGEIYDFNSREPLAMSLSEIEAEFLRRQIVTHTPGSLLAYLLDSGLYESVSDYRFDGLDDIFSSDLPENLYLTYRLALRFSRFALLLRLRYAMLYDIVVGADSAADDMLQRFNALLSEFRDDFTPEAIAEIITHISCRVQEESCKSFVTSAAVLIARGDFDGLDRSLMLREKAIKGVKRCKLINAADMQKGKPFECPGMMTYRWNTIVCTVLAEIREGIVNG